MTTVEKPLLVPMEQISDYYEAIKEFTSNHQTVFLMHEGRIHAVALNWEDAEQYDSYQSIPGSAEELAIVNAMLSGTATQNDSITIGNGEKI